MPSQFKLAKFFLILFQLQFFRRNLKAARNKRSLKLCPQNCNILIRSKRKVLLFLEIDWVKFFSENKQAKKNKKNKNTKKSKETKEEKRTSTKNRQKKINLWSPGWIFFFPPTFPETRGFFWPNRYENRFICQIHIITIKVNSKEHMGSFVLSLTWYKQDHSALNKSMKQTKQT